MYDAMSQPSTAPIYGFSIQKFTICTTCSARRNIGTYVRAVQGARLKFEYIRMRGFESPWVHIFWRSLHLSLEDLRLNSECNDRSILLTSTPKRAKMTTWSFPLWLLSADRRRVVWGVEMVAARRHPSIRFLYGFHWMDRTTQSDMHGNWS